jgi:formylglycine-generating enzyme required for sulfatase activity
MNKDFKTTAAGANSSVAMETETIQKNGVKPEPARRILLRIVGNVALVALLVFIGCKSSVQRHPGEPEMVKVKGGTFTMGTSEQGSDSYDAAHSVTVSSFSIGKYEVTQAQWKAIMGTTVSQQRDKTDPSWGLIGEGDNYPMYYVSWYEAQEFIWRLNVVTGKNYRLPTEAEWEYAARGGKKSRDCKYSGSNNLDEVAYSNSSRQKTHLAGIVGTKKANELDIYDMSGNVWEWCQDWYGKYSASSQQNPAGASNGYSHVCRGGSWDNREVNCRVVHRGYHDPDSRYAFLGFRVVLP